MTDLDSTAGKYASAVQALVDDNESYQLGVVSSMGINTFDMGDCMQDKNVEEFDTDTNDNGIFLCGEEGDPYLVFNEQPKAQSSSSVIRVEECSLSADRDENRQLTYQNLSTPDSRIMGSNPSSPDECVIIDLNKENEQDLDIIESKKHGSNQDDVKALSEASSIKPDSILKPKPIEKDVDKINPDPISFDTDLFSINDLPFQKSRSFTNISPPLKENLSNTSLSDKEICEDIDIGIDDFHTSFPSECIKRNSPSISTSNDLDGSTTDSLLSCMSMENNFLYQNTNVVQDLAHNNQTPDDVCLFATPKPATLFDQPHLDHSRAEINVANTNLIGLVDHQHQCWSANPDVMNMFNGNEETDDADEHEDEKNGNEFERIKFAFNNSSNQMSPADSVASPSSVITDCGSLSLSRPPSIPGLIEKADIDPNYFAPTFYHPIIHQAIVPNQLGLPVVTSNKIFLYQEPNLNHNIHNPNPVIYLTKPPPTFQSMADGMQAKRTNSKRGLTYTRSNNNRTNNNLKAEAPQIKKPKLSAKPVRGKAKLAQQKPSDLKSEIEDQLDDQMAENRSKSRHNEPLKQCAVEIMQLWYDKHVENPYPSKKDKEEMARQGGITENQVSRVEFEKRKVVNVSTSVLVW